MPLLKAEEHVEACSFVKIDNRKIRRKFYEENLEIKKTEAEIASKNIPRDRRFERIQLICRLRDKLEARRARRVTDNVS